MPLKNTPIRRKLMTMILLTSGVVLLLTCAAFFACEFLTFRQATVRQLSTLGEIIAANSTAALAFDNQDDAKEVLAALKADRHIVAASLYDKNGTLFSKYPETMPADAFPAAPEKDGYRFERSHLATFHPVVQGSKRLGTLYLKSDMEAMYERFRLYGGIAILAIVVSFLVAYTLSRALQQQISQPILALAETAKAISDRRDYSVRATKLGQDELGLLTDAFNQMLTQIHDQNGALRESEERVRAVLNSALSAVVVVDSDSKITDWNARAEQMFGWTRREAVGQKLSETIIPPRYQERHRRGLEHFLATGAGPVVNRLIEMSALRRDGSEFPVELSVSPLKTGDAVTFCGFITDITERKMAEASLRKSEAFLSKSQEIAHVGSWELSLPEEESGHEQLYWSDETYRVFGLNPGEVEPSSELFYSFVHPEDRQRVRERFTFALAERKPYVSDHRIVRSDGVLRDVHQRADVICDDKTERPSRVLGILQDITERKQAETKLQGQLTRLELLSRITRAISERQDLPSIFQVIIRSLEDKLPIDFGCVCLYDSAAETLTVTSVGVRSGALAMELALTEQARVPIDQNGLSRCVRGQLVYEPDILQVPFPFPQRLANSGLRSLVAAPLLVEGKVFGVLLAARCLAHSFNSADCEFLRQLSEQVALAAHQAQLYGTLQQAYDDLRETQHTVMQQERLRALGQMASGIAHDINNAISPIALYTESLLEREPNLSERARDYLGTIQRAIEDVAQTVAGMREFYRPREPQLTLGQVQLNHIIPQVVNLTRARWSDIPQKRGIVIRLETELPPELPGIMAVENEIRDALTNLILNAVDAMPSGGTLRLRTRAVPVLAPQNEHESATHVCLEVSDTGVGMNEETRRRCLEPFFTTKGERGTGLGLAMVYGMVQRHSSEMEIESKPGEGTTVRLIFAVATPMTASVRQPVLTPSAQYLRILIVDDDPLIIKSLRDTLESDGHWVTVADGGQAGIDAFVAAQQRGEPFDVVITDLGMPYVDGRNVAAAVKAASSATPVILLTGWGQRLLAEHDIPPHVDRLLNKPPKLQELRAALVELAASSAETKVL
jgi:PAS domain S-box-containing protein